MFDTNILICTYILSAYEDVIKDLSKQQVFFIL
nr:MAG TPA: hypothetical protein [Caudoviricetes sp.]